MQGIDNSCPGGSRGNVSVCGIAGALIYDSSTARLDNFQAAVNGSASRGVDSFGMVRWSPSIGFRHQGRLGPGAVGWLDAIGRPAADELTIYLHTSRAEPTTEWQKTKTGSDIPPFVDEGIAVAHNGIIANDDELAKKYDIRRASLVDTAVLPPLVARIGVWQAIASLKGGAALAVFDSRSESFVLGRNFLPLAIAWEPGVVCFASEARFFPNFDQPFRQFHLWELPPYSAIELSAGGFHGPFVWGDLPSPENESWLPFPSLKWE